MRRIRGLVWRAACAAIIVGALAVGEAPRAKGYTVSGSSWPGGIAPLWWTQRFNESGPYWWSRADDAKNEWNDRTHTPFSFVLEDRGGLIDVGSTNEGAIGGCDKPGLAAMLTSWNTTPGTYDIAWFRITVNTVCGIPWYDGSQGAAVPPGFLDLATYLRHELGHAQGICHTIAGGYLMSAGLPVGEWKFLDYDAADANAWIYAPYWTWRYDMQYPEWSCTLE